MKIVIGLGNPGAKFDETRHNVGFDIIDAFVDEKGLKIDKNKFKGIYTKFKLNGEDVVVLKPETYMNLSGESVIEVMNFFKVTNEDIIVIYDDISLDVGKIRIKKKGSAGGHNGIKNIIKMIGTEEFDRLRFGVGNKPDYMDLADYVLGRFNKEDKVIVDREIKTAVEALNVYLSAGIDEAMNNYN
ncbi:MAG: aminoacyl-tRNA hydrolase [Clostridia bacterium]|nr:aminoacyl-tRNA hydrolase [Clostridia bacterium]